MNSSKRKTGGTGITNARPPNMSRPNYKNNQPQPKPEQQMPQIFFSIGMTGAGKSTLNKMIEKESKNKGQNIKTLMIDDHIMANANYKKTVRAILTDPNHPVKSYKNLNSSVYKKFSTAYFGARRSGCPNYNIQPNTGTNKNATALRKTFGIKNGKGRGCNAIFDYDLFNALQKRHNVLYEQTGNSLLDIGWVLKAIPPEYKINMYYLLFSDLSELLKRNNKRGFNNANKFLLNNSAPAPRFPEMNIEMLKLQFENMLGQLEKAIDYQSNIHEYLSSSNAPNWLKYPINKKFSLHIRIYTNDNVVRGSNPTLLYDSENNTIEEGKQVVISYKNKINQLNKFNMTEHNTNIN